MPERKLRVFLCHASQDKPIVRELYQRLNAEGWIDPWLDEEKLLPGQDWDMEIEKAVRETDAVVVFLSTNSVDKEGYIQYEMRLVLRVAGYKPEGVIFIIPIRLNDCIVPMRLEIQHHVDFFPTERQEWAYQRLLQALRTRFEQESARREAEEKVRKEAEERARKEVEEIARKEIETQEQTAVDVVTRRKAEELLGNRQVIPGYVNILEQAKREKMIRENQLSGRQK